jgi:hypothetical protein
MSVGFLPAQPRPVRNLNILIKMAIKIPPKLVVKICTTTNTPPRMIISAGAIKSGSLPSLPAVQFHDIKEFLL